MNVFFAMGISTTTDDTGYWLRLPHLLSVFLIPIMCFYAFLAVWVVRKVRGALAAGPKPSDSGSASGPPADLPPSPGDAAVVAESKAEDPTPTRLELRSDVNGLTIQPA